MSRKARKVAKIKRRVPARLVVAIPGSAMIAPVHPTPHRGMKLATVPTLSGAIKQETDARVYSLITHFTRGTFRLRKRPR